jgi:hypothetical protein
LKMDDDSPYISEKGDTIGSIGWDIIFGACKLVAQICPHCDDAESLAIFMKDCVNLKIGKRIYNKTNFLKWIKLIQGGLEMQERHPQMTLTNEIELNIETLVGSLEEKAVGVDLREISGVLDVMHDV